MPVRPATGSDSEVRSAHAAHAAQVAATRHGRGVLLGLIGDDHFGGQQQSADRRGVLQRSAGHLGRVDDAGCEHVFDVLVGRSVVTVLAVGALADVVHHDAAFGTGVGCDLAGRLLQGALQDAGAGLLVTVQGLGQFTYTGDRVDQRDATTGDDAFLDRTAGGG